MAILEYSHAPFKNHSILHVSDTIHACCCAWWYSYQVKVQLFGVPDFSNSDGYMEVENGQLIWIWRGRERDQKFSWVYSVSSDSVENPAPNPQVSSTEIDEPSFYFDAQTNYWKVVVPLWFILFAFAATTIVLKPPPRYRYSLKEILIVMTIAVVVLGIPQVFKYLSMPVRLTS